MGAIEPRAIELLTSADAASGVALSAEAGWNQTEDDWRLFLRLGTVYGVRAADGSVVATAAILPYGGGAWISLVLVTASQRRQGLASMLVARCLAQADAAGQETWLDATPAGATVYGPLGFQPVCGLVRLRRAPASNRPVQRHPGGASAGVVPALLALDREALGLDRSALLTGLAGRPGSTVLGDERACCLVREGRAARHLGPLCGRDPGAVTELLNQVCAAEAGELVVDAYADQEAIRAALWRLGFSGERPFTRMRRGPARASRSVPELAFAGAGPEYG